MRGLYPRTSDSYHTHQNALARSGVQLLPGLKEYNFESTAPSQNSFSDRTNAQLNNVYSAKNRAQWAPLLWENFF